MPVPNSHPRRRFLRNTAVLAAVEAGAHAVGIGGLIQAVLARGGDPAIQGLRQIKGEVLVNGKPAAVGTLVLAGDTVTTGKGAEAIYVIGQDAYMQRESSTIIFAKNAMRVLSGKLLSVFGRGDKEIRVPTATIGIRGTGCYIEAAGDGPTARTYFCLCYGTADIVPTAAPHERDTITTTHHDLPRWINNDPAMTKMMTDAKVINHTDMELSMLEALVGRVPPFTAVPGYAPGKY